MKNKWHGDVIVRPPDGAVIPVLAAADQTRWSVEEEEQVEGVSYRFACVRGERRGFTSGPWKNSLDWDALYRELEAGRNLVRAEETRLLIETWIYVVVFSWITSRVTRYHFSRLIDYRELDRTDAFLLAITSGMISVGLWATSSSWFGPLRRRTARLDLGCSRGDLLVVLGATTVLAVGIIVVAELLHSMLA